MSSIRCVKLNIGDVYSFNISLFGKSDLKINDLFDQNFNVLYLITNKYDDMIYPTFKIIGFEFNKKSWWKFWQKKEIKEVIAECIYVK